MFLITRTKCRFCNLNRLFLLTSLIVSALAVQVNAQGVNGRLSIGMAGGLTVFNGDVTKNEFIPSITKPTEIRMAGGLQLTGVLNPYLSLRYSWVHGKLHGVKDPQQFNCRFNDHSFQLLLNVNAVLFEKPEEAWITVFGILGYGLVKFRSERLTYPGGNLIQAFGYDSNGKKNGSATQELSIPVGFSLRTRLDRFIKDYESFMASDRVEFMFDVMVHIINSDKMDALAGTSGNDKFLFMSLGVSYYFF